MSEHLPASRHDAATELRDLMLRRLIVVFIAAAVVTFWTAVGMAVWHETSHRIELAQQQASVSATQP